MDADDVPIWFLDVDGVVNALAPDSYADRGYLRGGPHGDLYVQPSVVEYVNSVHRRGLARIVWLTCWYESARTDLAPEFGFDDFDAVPCPSNDTDATWWKVRAIERLAGSRFVFSDDSLGMPEVSALSAIPSQALLIAPDTRTGLEPWHLTLIETFLTHSPAN